MILPYLEPHLDTSEGAGGLPLTVGALLRARTEEFGNLPLITVDDDVLTYEAAFRRSGDLARGLLAAGAGVGTRIALLYPNGPDFVVGWLAAARIGAVGVPLSTFSTTPELVALLRGADVSMLLSATAYRSHDYAARMSDGFAALDLQSPPPLLAGEAPSLRRIAFSGDVPGTDPGWMVDGLVADGADISNEVLAAAEALVAPADAMVIVHTSGSTSEPKGVVHTHGSLIRHLDNLNQLRRYDADEVLFANSPFFWIGGFAYALLGTIVAGARLVCSNATTAAAVLDVLERERPTMVNGFAASIAHLPADPSFAGRDLSSIRRGNLYPIMPADVRPADPELRHSMLGMTEAGSVCLASDDDSDQPEHRRNSFGRPVPGFEVDIREGEIWFRSPFLMEGYLGRERHETFDADGWYCTGDLASMDDDGFIYFRGRASDMIKTAGANVSPREVEAAILDITGLVSHVVGLDDPERGQTVAALVLSPSDADAGADGRPELDIDELRAGLKERISAYKVPKRFVTIAPDDVPIMSSGKLDLRAVKELLGRA